MPGNVQTKAPDEKTNSDSLMTEKKSGLVTVKGSVEIDIEKCKGCGLCAMSCVKGFLAMSESLNTRGYTPAIVVKPEKCAGCTLCALMCPDVAIKVYKKR